MNQTATKTKSHTAAIFPVLVALDKFKEKGIDGFTGTSEDQKYLLSLLPTARSVKYSEDEVKSFISNNVQELNAILKSKGFDIQFDESQAFDLGVVTIMDLMAKWLAKADPAEVMYDGKKYPAAKIKRGASVMLSTVDTEVLMIRTINGITVFIEKTYEERSGLVLFHHVLKMSSFLSNEYPCDAIVPFVDIDEQPDVSWLLGLNATNKNFAINQALQQNRLKINLDGVHAESATAVGGVRGLIVGRSQFIVDQPFNIWLTSGNSQFPLFAAYVAPENWKEPK